MADKVKGLMVPLSDGRFGVKDPEGDLREAIVPLVGKYADDPDAMNKMIGFCLTWALLQAKERGYSEVAMQDAAKKIWRKFGKDA